MGVSGREREVERERERERVEAGHDHVWGGKSPRGREVRVCGRAVNKEREEGQVAPLIVPDLRDWA